MPTSDEYKSSSSPTNTSERKQQPKVQVNVANPFAQQDYHQIVNAFEKSSADWAEEDYAIASHYKDIYSTRNFSERVQEQMAYYPGLHQSSTGVPEEEPYGNNAQKQAESRFNYWADSMSSPDAFMNGLRSREQDFDYRTVFGSDASAKTRAENVGKMFTECIPCFGRLLDADGLVPDGDLLEVHALNTNLRFDLIKDTVKLLKDPGPNLDICELISLLSKMCPQDLFAILALLTQYLAKLNLDIKFNIDFIANLVGAILSPFLDALSQWLDKWIQLIIEPLVCVVDHINEVIVTSQTMKIPLSSAGVGIDADLGAQTGVQNNKNSSSKDKRYQGSNTPWPDSEMDRFNDLPPGHYNRQRPKVPAEEIEMSIAEAKEAWNPSMSEAQREETNKKWQEINNKRRVKLEEDRTRIQSQRRDGSRWSKDNVPNSEKFSIGYQLGDEYHPPEKQQIPKQADRYLDLSATTNSIVQMRNILQAGIQYVRDWFTYITQMIYDLLGSDFGWMKNKTGSSFMKVNLIRIISLVKAIIQAASKNGLRCGVNSNLDQDQVKFILEDTLNKFSPTQFKVLDNGDIKIIPPSRDLPNAIDLSKAVEEAQVQPQRPIDMGEGIGKVSDKKAEEILQESVESGIIIKNCLKDLTTEEAARAREWILEYERRSNG